MFSHPAEEKNLDLRIQCWDNDFRLEKVFHLGTQLFTQSPQEEVGEVVVELLKDDPDQAISKLYWAARTKEIMEEEDIPLTNEDEALEWIAEMASEYGIGMGFLLQVATPVREFIGDEFRPAYTSSWGYYRTGWVYGDTFEEAFQKAAEWTQKQIESMKQGS